MLKALQAAVNEIPARLDMTEHYARTGSTDVSAETSVDNATPAMQRADALGLMAESFLQHGAEAMSGGDRHQVVLHVSAETLRDDEAGRSEIEDGSSLAAETVRRLACDCSLVPILEDEHGQPLNIGRKTRSIPPSLRRALNSRDQGCRFPGCTHKHYVDGHHIEHWAHGGETKLGNLVTLCRFHHRLVHEGGIRVEILDDGAFRFLKLDGTSIDSIAPGYTQPISDWRRLPAIHHENGIHVNEKTAATRWRGERMDYGLAVQVLAIKQARADEGGAFLRQRE